MSAEQLPTSRASLRGWFGMIAYLACWCGVFRAFPVIAVQLLDLIWHEWSYWLMYQWRNPDWSWCSLFGLSLLLVACVRLIMRPKSSASLLWFTLGWAFVAAAFLYDQYFQLRYPISWNIARFDMDCWVLFNFYMYLLPAVVLTLTALALGVIPARRGLTSARWLVIGWVILQFNLMLLIGLELGLIDFYFSGSRRPRGSLCHPSGEFFTPLPTSRKGIIIN